MKDPGFNYVANKNAFFQPHTPYGALKAAEEGLLPAEAYTYMAVSVGAIADNPENLDEIERMLGQKNRDLDTNVLLIDVLNGLIKNEDKEIALFAAESINEIENDYNRAVEKLADEAHRERAILYMEMAVLNKAIDDLRLFYLREAFLSFRRLEKKHSLQNSDRLLMVRILTDLNLLTQAENIIIENKIQTSEALFLLADIAFRQRDFSKLARIISELDDMRASLDSDQQLITDYWMGKE